MTPFRIAATRCLAEASGVSAGRIADLLVEAEPDRGEFALPCFLLAKELRTSPHELAAKIAAAAQLPSLLASVTAAGPYVNVAASRPAVAQWVLTEVEAAGDAWGASGDGGGRVVVIDYSSPNIAKPLAFHHLRSTMIGHSLCRMYESQGWQVIGINHLGDWGTAFGKLLLAWELYGRDRAIDALDAAELNELYVRVNAAIAEDDERGGNLRDRARSHFRALESGDQGARAVWEKFRRISVAEFEETYELLGVSFTHTWGESHYEDLVGDAIEDLDSKGLLEQSEGATIVSLDECGLPPCLIKKADGATLYATRDIAAALYRHAQFGFTRALYVTDAGQSLHFDQVKGVLKRAGHDWADGIQHVPFGLVRIGGKRARTRKGAVVLLSDVLATAVAKVRRLIREKNPTLQEAEDTARDVGVGAVVFNDLRNRRETDVDFDLDAIVSFEGRTGPYVMYSHARACSILDRAGNGRTHGEGDSKLLDHEFEYRLMRLVALFPDRVWSAVGRNEPSEVAKYLLDLCEAFHAYHSAGGRDVKLRVLSADRALRTARLRLTEAVRQTMANALHLLGMHAPRKM